MNNLITNIYAYFYGTLLLFNNNNVKHKVFTVILKELDFLQNTNLDFKKHINKLTKIITNLNNIVKTEELNRKEKNYLNDIRNYLLQTKNLLSYKKPDNTFEYLSSLTNKEFKYELEKISKNSGTIFGKLKNPVTGSIINVERQRKSSKLNFHDKNYLFTYLIKKNK